MTIVWTLKVRDPKSDESKDFILKRNPISLGRGSSNDMKLKNKKVSSRHAVLTYENERVFIEDQDSTNGTFIYKKGTWKRLQGKIRVRPPVMINVGKALNIIVKAEPEEVYAASKFSNLEGLDTHSSFVEEIRQVESYEAVMVLDLCQSSAIADTDEKMAFHMKKKLKEICEWTFEERKARFIKSTGDGYLATFHDPSNALFAVKQILHDLKLRNERTNNAPIHIRTALHVGKTYTIDDVSQDIHGNDVNITFRVEGVQEDSFGGSVNELPEYDRILCTYEFFSSVENEGNIMGNFTFKRIGETNLKGIKEPKEIYLVTF